MTKVDDSDYKKLSESKWYLQKQKNVSYAIRRVFKNGKLVPERMHRIILGVKSSSIIVDHKDTDGLNNQRLNLRICNRSQNGMNRRSNEKSTSKYKGVYWHGQLKTWAASIRHNNKSYHIGLFKEESDAALAYNKKASELFGEFSNLNNIE